MLINNVGKISFQEYLLEGISHPVFYGDLVNKIRRVKCEANFVSSGSKIVKRLRSRKYDPVIIERTIGLVLATSTAFYSLKRCTLAIWRALSKHPQRRQGPDPCLLCLLVGTPSESVQQFFYVLHFYHTCSLCRVELVVQFPARGSTQVVLCLFPGVTVTPPI